MTHLMLRRLWSPCCSRTSTCIVNFNWRSLAKNGERRSAKREKGLVMSASLKSLQGVDGDVDLSKKLPLDGFTRAFSLNERLQAGRALRDSAPRRTHSAWKRTENGRDPVDILLASDADRLQELVPIRYGRMLRSPFAFYRGSAGIMAADLSATAQQRNLRASMR